jgi:hypothetical protein
VGIIRAGVHLTKRELRKPAVQDARLLGGPPRAQWTWIEGHDGEIGTDSRLRFHFGESRRR